jgi:copper oxidase (laccase) domain-containing protein
VGPSLSGKSFVVREDMWALFGETSHNRKYFENVEGNNDEKHFHVWKYVEDVWLSMGVKEVKNVRINTYENENFSSWRRDFQAGFFKPRANNYSLITFS